MRHFKVGDRVSVAPSRSGRGTSGMGRIISYEEGVEFPVRLQFDNGVTVAVAEERVTVIREEESETERLQSVGTPITFTGEGKDVEVRIATEKLVAEVERLQDVIRDERKQKEALREEAEKERIAAVAEEFGEVTERHLWEICVKVPVSKMGTFFGSKAQVTHEIATTTDSAVEAAIVAEGVAKRRHEFAVVQYISYRRSVSAIK